MNEELVENTIATVENTSATREGGGLSEKVQIAHVILCGIALAVTCLLGVRSNEFAQNQAGLIISGVVGGVFGAAVSTKR